MSTYHSDYMNEPIGGGNPYYRCVHCHRSDPEINGRIEGHSSDCAYRQAKEMGTPYPPIALGEECGIMFDDPPFITDLKGCRCRSGHDGPHQFIDDRGREWHWETDLSCTCEHCMQCEGDYCTIYWENKPLKGSNDD